MPKDEAEMIHTKGTERYSHGYQGSLYGYRDFSRLHRLCRSCLKKAVKKDGSKSSYDSMAENRSTFHMKSVEDFERRDDGLYIKKLGVWKKFDGDNKLSNTPRTVVRRVASKWGLPETPS